MQNQKHLGRGLLILLLIFAGWVLPGVVFGSLAHKYHWQDPNASDMIPDE